MAGINGSLLHRTAAISVLLFVLMAASATSEAAAKVAVVAFGLFGDQSVFESEARAAARIVASRFSGDSVVVRANTKTRKDATIETLGGALRSVALTVDPEQDVLFLMLTSHGSRDGLAVKAGGRTETLSPVVLKAMLAFTGVRHRVVILSACYSGIFIPVLASPDTLVITAADANHPSFGCKDGAKWTYFGEAFFNAALRHATNLREAFSLARKLVRQRERRDGFEPSNPQILGGENVIPLLDRLMTSLPSRPIACTRSRKQAYPPVSLRRDSKWRFVAPERTATRLHGFSRFNRPRFGAHSGNFSSLPCAEFAAGVPLEACAGIIPIIMSAGFTVQEFAGITFAKQSWRVVCA